MSSSTILKIGALVRRDGADVDALVADFARSLTERGWRVRGLVQEMRQEANGCVVSLVDLENGQIRPITQSLGAHSASCCLDPSAIADASAVLRKIVVEGADLAIFNRFSALEAGGGGFQAEMLALMAEGIPSLTIVPEKHLAVWRDFTGGLGSELAATRESLELWFETTANPLGTK
jgi:hypothetical protein